jgi:hypothetical protein
MRDGFSPIETSDDGDDDDDDWTFGTEPPVTYRFRSPFTEFESFLSRELTPPVPNESELLFLFRSAWLDPLLCRNRSCACFPVDSFRPEELGLLLLAHDALGLRYPSALPLAVLTAFCVCTGRLPIHLEFDPSTRCGASSVSFRAPTFMSTHVGHGPSLASPTFIHRALRERVPFPSAHFKFFVDERVVGESGDVAEALRFTGRPVELEPWGLRFDRAVMIPIDVFRYATRDGGWWCRVKSSYFEIAFGDNFTNEENPRVRYRWENRFNGECPPTLSRTGSGGSVRWLEDPRVHDPVEDPALAEYCPIGSPRLHSAAVRHVNRDLFEGLKNWTFIWADPMTGRIRDEDLRILVDEDDGFSVCECNEACPCMRRCPCCLSSRGSLPQLALFYDPDKQWGVAATDTIEAGELITVYSGKLVSDREGRREIEDKYYFAVEFGDSGSDMGYDAAEECNIARFINMSHADSTHPFEQPNARALNIVWKTVATAIIGIFSRRKIYKGEEITIYYGDDYRDVGDCACNGCTRDQHVT